MRSSTARSVSTYSFLDLPASTSTLRPVYAIDWLADFGCVQGSFPGLLGVVNAYLDSLNVEFTAKSKMKRYLELIKRRADGTSPLSNSYY